MRSTFIMCAAALVVVIPAAMLDRSAGEQPKTEPASELKFDEVFLTKEGNVDLLYVVVTEPTAKLEQYLDLVVKYTPAALRQSAEHKSATIVFAIRKARTDKYIAVTGFSVEHLREIHAAGLQKGRDLVLSHDWTEQEIPRKKDEKAVPHLDAVLRVEINKKREISCRFDLPGKVDQSFYSTEYRYAVLDKDGVQVDKALMINGAALHTVALPKAKRSVVDESEFTFDEKQLKSGAEYYLVVSVRNLTGLAKFKVP